jgi:hypothetical protein
MYKLNNLWSCWIHYQNDNDWTIDSYNKISEFSNLQQLVLFVENLNEAIIKKTMLFFMKEKILPLWESEDNINGGYFSYKINNNDIVALFKIILYKIIGASFIDDETILNNINGVSVSPKKNFCIIKIWMKDKKSLKSLDFAVNKDPFNIHTFFPIDQQVCVFKAHKQ